jgi:Mn2+/Fe2+ NRAMP family transporter
VKKILAIVAVIVVAFIGIQMYGDQDTKDAANDAAEGAKDAADKAGDQANPNNIVGWLQGAADWLASLPDTVWRTIVPLLIVGGALIWVAKDARRRSIALGVAVLALLVMIVANVV